MNTYRLIQITLSPLFEEKKPFIIPASVVFVFATL